LDFPSREIAVPEPISVMNDVHHIIIIKSLSLVAYGLRTVSVRAIARNAHIGLSNVV
jgi:hypothetical protein